MAQKNKNLNVFQIFFKSIWFYFRNFFAYSEVMIFPVGGQFLGMAMILLPAFIYNQNSTLILSATKNNIPLSLGILALCIVPGFLVFFKAFWEYLICYVSLNTITVHIMSNNKKEELGAYSNRVKNRKNDYSVLLSVFALIWVIASLAPLSVLALNIDAAFKPIALIGLYIMIFCVVGVVSYYLSLSYQVFAFETLSVVSTLRRSMELVEKNFLRTVLLSILIYIFSGNIMPELLNKLIQSSGLAENIIKPLESYVSLVIPNPRDLLKMFSFMKLQSSNVNYEVAKMVLSSQVSLFVSQFLLPIGSIAYTFLYQDILKRK